MISCNLYYARVVERHLFDNLARTKKAAFLLLAFSQNEKRKRTHRFWVRHVFNNRQRRHNVLLGFECFIDALWEDFDRSIAETRFHIIADDRSHLLTIAIIWKLG